MIRYFADVEVRKTINRKEEKRKKEKMEQAQHGSVQKTIIGANGEIANHL